MVILCGAIRPTKTIHSLLNALLVLILWFTLCGINFQVVYKLEIIRNNIIIIIIQYLEVIAGKAYIVEFTLI